MIFLNKNPTLKKDFLGGEMGLGGGAGRGVDGIFFRLGGTVSDFSQRIQI